VACVEEAEEHHMKLHEWIKSSFSNNSCVEVLTDGEAVAVKSSKAGDNQILSFDGDEWLAFIAGVKNGEFDV
jgi:hypothetical protein